MDCFSYAVNYYTEATRKGDKVTWCGYFAPIFSSIVFIGVGAYIIADSVDTLLNENHSVDTESMVISQIRAC